MTYDDIVKFWQDKKITNAAELEAALNGYIISFAYHSGKIENDNITYNDTREIFDHDGVTSYTGDLRTLFEIRNAKDASNFILDAFDKKQTIDSNFICKLQFELTKNTYDPRRYSIGERPGEFKKHDYVTGKNETGALPEDVPAELNELLADISMPLTTTKQILTGAAYFHAKFENIHPFSDGNGRTGRLAMNYFLLQHNHPPIVFHEEDRKEYYSSLEMWDTLQNLDALKLFIQMETIKTWEKYYNRKHKKDDLAKAVEDIRAGRNLSKVYHNTDELFKDLGI